MTLDRDIRFSSLQIRVTERALRDEVRKHDRSIRKAEQARSRGERIQQNVLDSHYVEREAALQVLDSLKVAHDQIARRIADAALGVKS